MDLDIVFRNVVDIGILIHGQTGLLQNLHDRLEIVADAAQHQGAVYDNIKLFGTIAPHGHQLLLKPIEGSGINGKRVGTVLKFKCVLLGQLMMSGEENAQ